MIKASTFLFILLIVVSCNSRKNFERLVNVTSKNRDNLIQALDNQITPEYLRTIEKYTESFIEVNSTIKNLSDKKLKKIKKEYVESICERVLLSNSDLDSLQKDCTHPHFKFCPEPVYRMKEILASLTKRVKQFHDLSSYPACADKLGE